MERIGEFLYKYRYLCGLLIIVLAVVFDLNGSSIGMWNEAFSLPDNHVLAGTPRAIRTDEWRALTPMTISQNKAFSWFSDIIRGTRTDVFMIYPLPVLTPFILFRPFLAGYLVLGASRGLAFFWAARLVFLWLSSVELFYMLSKQKGLSALGATLIAFSPLIQWWFAVNSLVEMIIAGNYAVVAFDKYLSDQDTKKRAGYAFAIAWCAGVFGLSLYPAWMVPLAYVYLALAIWILVSRFGQIGMKRTDILITILAGVILLASVGIIVYISRDTIATVAGTAYPGARFETGGGMWKENFYYVFNAFYPTVGYFGSSNACETSAFMSFFPMGIVLGGMDVIARARKKSKQDLPVILMLALSVFFLIYCGVGFPGFLAEITLLSQSPAYRCIAIIGFIQILLMVRTLSRVERCENPGEKERTQTALAAETIVTALTAVILSAVAVYGGILCTEGYLGKKRALIMGLILTVIFFGMMNYQRFRVITNVLMVGLVFYAGATVNPVQKGLSTIYESELAGMIADVVAEDPGALWIVDDMNNEMTNYPIMMGAATVNSTNTYPALERWSAIDCDGANSDIYNRYAHIAVSIVSAGEGTGFELLAADNFKVNMTPGDLKTLQVDYILTDRELEKFSDSQVTFTLVGVDESDRRADNPDVRYRIYKVEGSKR
ncbi:MAG: hypothetical protein K6G30_13135 [Acetatifactor sp.]|nr:hypothetical protein [Acetatifactor sp.]